MKYLWQAGKPVFLDFLSTIAFFLVFSSLHNIVLATAVGVAVGVGQTTVQLLRRRPVEPMAWMSTALVVVLGGATILTHDPRFIMVKPTIAYLATAGVMSRPGWQVRYAPEIARRHLSDRVLTIWGFVWAGGMAALGIAALVIGLSLGVKAWVWFLAVFAVGAKLALFAVEYVSLRHLVRGRIIAARAAESPAPGLEAQAC